CRRLGRSYVWTPTPGRLHGQAVTPSQAPPELEITTVIGIEVQLDDVVKPPVPGQANFLAPLSRRSLELRLWRAKGLQMSGLTNRLACIPSALDNPRFCENKLSPVDNMDRLGEELPRPPSTLRGRGRGRPGHAAVVVGLGRGGPAAQVHAQGVHRVDLAV